MSRKRAVGRSIPTTGRVKELLLLQRNAFIEKFGREPGPDDPIFFHPYKDEPTPLPKEFEQVLDAARAAFQSGNSDEAFQILDGAEKRLRDG